MKLNETYEHPDISLNSDLHHTLTSHHKAPSITSTVQIRSHHKFKPSWLTSQHHTPGNPPVRPRTPAGPATSPTPSVTSPPEELSAGGSPPRNSRLPYTDHAQHHRKSHGARATHMRVLHKAQIMPLLIVRAARSQTPATLEASCSPCCVTSTDDITALETSHKGCETVRIKHWTARALLLCSGFVIAPVTGSNGAAECRRCEQVVCRVHGNR